MIFYVYMNEWTQFQLPLILVYNSNYIWIDRAKCNQFQHVISLIRYKEKLVPLTKCPYAQVLGHAQSIIHWSISFTQTLKKIDKGN